MSSNTSEQMKHALKSKVAREGSKQEHGCNWESWIGSWFAPVKACFDHTFCQRTPFFRSNLVLPLIFQKRPISKALNG